MTSRGDRRYVLFCNCYLYPRAFGDFLSRVECDVSALGIGHTRKKLWQLHVTAADGATIETPVQIFHT